VTGWILPLELHNLVLHEVYLEERVVGLLRNDELHNVRCIHGGLLVDNALIHLLVNIIHHIKRLRRGVQSLAKDMVSINHEVDQTTLNSIQVSSLGGNGGPEHAKAKCWLS
jgi:hypothetical protein